MAGRVRSRRRFRPCRKAHAQLMVERVPRRIVPEEDDTFAKSIGFERLEALRSDYRRQLEQAAQRQADEFVARDLLAGAVKRSTVHFPQSMVDAEVAHRVDTLLKGL